MVFIKKQQTSLRRTLILSVLAVHITIFLITLIINFFLLFHISEEQTITEAHNNLEYLEYQMSSLASNLTDIRNLLLQDNNVMEYLRTERLTSPDDITLQINTSQRLSQLIQSYTYLDSISLFQWNSNFISISQRRISLGINQDDRLPIQSAAAFKNLTASSPLTWGGCYNQDEMFTNHEFPSKQKKNIISLLMPLVNIWHPGQTAIVSLNIPQSYFNFLYSKNVSKGANIYLFDDNGNFLLNSTQSGSNQSVISDYGKKIIKTGNSSGHFDSKDHFTKYKVIYRKDIKTGWYLAEEIPYPVFLNNMFYLQSITGITFFISIIVILIICYIVTRRLLHSLEVISKQISHIGEGNLQKRLPSTEYTELNRLTDKFNHMMGKLENLMNEKIKDEADKRELEIEVLQAQINPHFLYNSLTTIRWMASMARAGNVCQALLALNNVLRPIFSQPGVLWSIQDEHVFLENFVDIMNYRFGENIKCVYHLPKELESVQILRFLLQPMVENCIIHGLRGQPDSLITIDTECLDSILILSVCDNGQGIPPEELDNVTEKMSSYTKVLQKEGQSSHGFGLYNVNRRIKLQYGETYGFQITSTPGQGTCIRIHIPLNRNSKKE